MWNLNFISECDFKTHVENTIRNYGNKLVAYDLNRFNSNIVDPIKIIFDKHIFNNSWEDVIKNEIVRQRDKTNNNEIGYFHQKIFQYIEGCVVPNEGWDVIFSKPGRISLPQNDNVGTVFVEMKNKHNTMNSASSAKTYMKMQGQLLHDDDCACFLVEAIAKRSQNIPWVASVDGMSQRHRRIRRVSMDEFYRIVTGQEDAFYQMCLKLPEVINEVVNETTILTNPCDTVFEELNYIAQQDNGSFVLALYMLGFGTYHGFRD